MRNEKIMYIAKYQWLVIYKNIYFSSWVILQICKLKQ